MAVTANEETRKHYQRPEVESVIRKFCTEETNNSSTLRALNGDAGWYIKNKNGMVQLRTIAKYANTIDKYRTLYATLDNFEVPVALQSEAWDDEKEAPVKPIGTFENCVSYTLGVDIDSIPPEGKDITTSPETKNAVEDAAQFFVDYLKTAGIEESVYCLYSGGGIYILIHHGLFKAKDDWTPQERDQAFRSVTGAYNLLIGSIEKEFFESLPEHQGRVKFDKLNHQKRKFKVIFSIHKTLPFAVIPLNPLNIKIDFDKARLPLRPEVLAEGANWYKTYDLNEKERLQSLLAPYVEVMSEDLKQRKDIGDTYDVSKRSKPLPMDDFPPCIKNILEKAEPGLGPHRACAVLATYLYQIGWGEEEAFDLWAPVAERARVETRIFAEWYSKMSCPSCATIQRESAGYPKLGLGGLGYCESDEKCKECKWPGGYGNSPSKTTLENAILYLAACCDGAKTKDGAGFNKRDTTFGKELEKKIESGQELTPDDSRRARKMLKKYSKQLAAAGIDYEDIAKSHAEILPPIPGEICGIEGGYSRTILIDPEKVNVRQLIFWHLEDLLVSDRLNQIVFDKGSAGEPYLWFKVNDHYEMMSIVSSPFADLLAKRVLEDVRNDKCLAVSSTNLKDNLPTIRTIGKTITAGLKCLPIETELIPRIKQIDNAIWYDLGRKDCRGVKITTDGLSLEPLPIGFIRRGSMLEQEEPDLNATASDALTLKTYFPKSLSRENSLLCMVWLVSGFIGSISGTKIPKVHILISGPHGSAKSTILNLMVYLLDPDADPLKKMPTTQRDAAALLRGYNVVILDNIGHIEQWLSDTLCQASTGGASTDRELYSNFDTVTARYNARVGMTSLGISRMEPDLLDRTLKIYTNAMPPGNRNSLADIYKRFESDKPVILGGLFKTVVEILRVLPDVLNESKTWPDKPRMLDFCVIGEACSRVWGNEPGYFKKIYNISLQSEATDLLNEVEVLDYLLALVDKNGGKWSGLTSSLLVELNDLYKDGNSTAELPERWPRHAGSLGKMISKYSADLLKSGYKIIGPTHTNEGSWLCIERESSSPTHISQSKIDTYTVESNSVDGDGQQSLPSPTQKNGASTCRQASNAEMHQETKQDTSIVGSNAPVNSENCPEEGATCPVCHEDVGPGHSSCTFEEKRYCASCTAHLKMLRESVKVLATKNGCGPTTSEIYQCLALQSRPPRKQHLPAMLGCLGFVEVDGGWVESSAIKQPDSLEIRLKSALERLQCEGKPIVAHVLAESLGCGITEIGALLRALGYKQSTKMDPVSHMMMWIKDDDTSGDAEVNDAESSSANVGGETNETLVNAGEGKSELGEHSKALLSEPAGGLM